MRFTRRQLSSVSVALPKIAQKSAKTRPREHHLISNMAQEPEGRQGEGRRGRGDKEGRTDYGLLPLTNKNQ